MEKVAEWLLNWLQLGPLKGYRTQILAAILFGLAGAKAVGVLHLDDKTYTELTTILTGAIGLTAAYKKPA